MFFEENERCEMVVKSNDLIQKSRFSLTTNQQKIILYLISKLKYKDTDFTECKVDIKDFCRVCGIDLSNGRRYNELKNSIKQIADKSIWIEKENGDETLLRWIEKPTIHKNDGVITIRLDEDLKPYLLELKEKYTQYELIYTLKMKSKYSIDELKKLLDAENYKGFKDFRRRVLEKAIEEINAFTDIQIELTAIKQGKTITEIEIHIETKEPLERFKTAIMLERSLNNE